MTKHSNHTVISLLEAAPRWWAAAASLLLSLYFTYTGTPVNFDGILYLRVAEAWQQGGFDAAMALYDRPVYSIVIASLANILPVGLIWSAHLFNAVMAAAMAWFVVDQAILYSRSQRVGLWAALLFLLHPHVNIYREYIIRDFAFWALCLAFLSLMLRFVQRPRLHYIFLAYAAVLLAYPFRTEALVFLLLPPILIPLLRKERAFFVTSRRLFAGGLLLFALVCALLYVMESQYFHTLLVYIYRSAFMVSMYLMLLFGKAQSFTTNFLSEHLIEYAYIAVAAGVVATVLAKSLSVFSLPYTIIVACCYRFHKYLRIASPLRRTLFSYMALHFLLIVLFIVMKPVIQGRHVLLLTLAFLPYLACMVEVAWRQSSRNSRSLRRAKNIAVIMGALLLLDSFVSFGASKEHYGESFAWFASLPEGCSMLSNDPRYGVYTDLDFDWNEGMAFQRDNEYLLGVTKRYDFLVIEHRRNKPLKEIMAYARAHYPNHTEFSSKKRVVDIFYDASSSHEGCDLSALSLLHQDPFAGFNTTQTPDELLLR